MMTNIQGGRGDRSKKSRKSAGGNRTKRGDIERKQKGRKGGGGGATMRGQQGVTHGHDA